MKKTTLVLALIFLIAVMMPLSAFLAMPKQTNPIKVLLQDGLLVEITNCTIQNGVSYSKDASPYRVMDIYIPEGEGPFPAIIYVHGGGWSRGSRADFSETALFYAKRGIAGFSIDYTLSTNNKTAWPENIQDVVEAIRYIRENAKQFRIDDEKVAILGSSSGAQLASLAGTLYGDESFLKGSSGNEEIRKQVCLVIDYSGATDLQFIGENLEGSFIYRVTRNALGNVTYGMNPNLWIEASPATYISAGDPVFCIIHGTNDTIVPISVAESFNAKLQATGIESHFIMVEDGDHDILTSETQNQIVRYSLEPLMEQIFNHQKETASNLLMPFIVLAPMSIAVLVVVYFKYAKNLNFAQSLNNYPIPELTFFLIKTSLRVSDK
ncbi:MAG: alpha/beta hydrolase [Candidatus Bathyarchaeota archaeon]|nr:alpha/beta hydrolase [Candidatus Bathyarchaeota archaeon]